MEDLEAVSLMQECLTGIRLSRKEELRKMIWHLFLSSHYLGWILHSSQMKKIDKDVESSPIS